MTRLEQNPDFAKMSLEEFARWSEAKREEMLANPKRYGIAALKQALQRKHGVNARTR